MQRWYKFPAAMVAALALLCQSAEAGPRSHRDDQQLFVTGLVAGAAGTAAYFSLRDWRWHKSPNAKVSAGGAAVAGTMVCAALSPILGTIAVKRELTLREAHAMTADCIVPFIGGWLVNKAYDDHPEWEGKSRRRR